MANIRVKDLPNTDTLADADELIVDSSSAGTRRVSYSELKTEVAADYVAAPTTYKVAPLNSSNKIDATYLPTTGDTAKGGWNATTNTPTLANGTGNSGDYYDVTTAGVSLGISFSVGDVVKYDGANWFKIDSVANIFDGVSTVDQVKTLAQVPDIGLQANQVPLSGMLNSGAWLDFDAFYETGTWVPDLTFSGLKTGVAYTTQSGNYVKVGKSVTIHCHIVLTSAGSDSGNLRIDGLPFTSIAGQYSSGSVGYVTGMGAGGLTVTPTFFVNANSKEINFYKFGGSTVAKADVADNMNIRFSATYQIA